MKKSRTLLSATLFALIICASTTQINAMGTPWCGSETYATASAAGVAGGLMCIYGGWKTIYASHWVVRYRYRYLHRGHLLLEEEKKELPVHIAAIPAGIVQISQGVVLMLAATAGREVLNSFCTS